MSFQSRKEASISLCGRQFVYDWPGVQYELGKSSKLLEEDIYISCGRQRAELVRCHKDSASSHKTHATVDAH